MILWIPGPRCLAQVLLMLSNDPGAFSREYAIESLHDKCLLGSESCYLTCCDLQSIGTDDL